MYSDARARLELLADTGTGFHAGECIERTSFRGQLDRDFFVNLPRAVRGFRLDPLDTAGEFRLNQFEIRRVSRFSLLGRALWSTFQQAGTGTQAVVGFWQCLKLLVTGHGRELKQRLLEQVDGPSALAPPPYDPKGAYEAWRRAQRWTDADRARARAEIAALAGPPLISLFLPLPDGPAGELRRTVESVRRQLYPHWELYLVGAAGSVLEEAVEADPRIKLRLHAGGNGVAHTANSSLALAAGRYIAFLDAGDELPEHALGRVALAAAQDEWDLLYTDEDCLGADGRYGQPFFKPDWSPEYLLSYPYTGRLAVYRATLVRELGGFREDLEPAHEYDLVLRVLARLPRVQHIADVLYHRHEANFWAHGPPDSDAGRRAVADHLERTGRLGRVEPGPVPHLHRVRIAVAGRPRVSIILPTAYRTTSVPGEHSTYLGRCLASVREQTTYPNYEILMFDNGEPPQDIEEDLKKNGIVPIAYGQPFNWAATMNQGAAHAAGEHLVFLDDDTEVITPDWLECLLEYSQQPDIGAVGARLHFPDGRLQHAGITVLDGRPGHPFYGSPGDHRGYFFSSAVPRNWSAVTGACLMTRAEIFRELGGFAEKFAFNFNDVDYCLRVARSGRRVVCNPYAQLFHHETATKAEYFPTELHAFRDHWRRQWPRDPYSNPNLSTRFHDFRIEPQ
jgi:GT2 family glycosyltransferase